MRWQGRRRSTNVNDRRTSSGGKLLGGGIGVVIIGLVIYLLGGDPSVVLQQVQQGGGATEQEITAQAEDKEFVEVVLADTEDVWNKLFREQLDMEYQEPQLTLFSGSINSGCGMAGSATGPFYCPLDNNVYIDLTFYDDLKSRFDAPGDFAMAYVVAHEVGHHIQNQLGISDKVQQMRGQVSETEYNRMSVRLELQADFLAGVWAHHAQRMKNILEEGDIAEALNAANAIGDDRLQREAQGRVVPDAFTHGTSAQRMRWFKKGFETGDIEQGDTFAAQEL